MRTYTLRNDFHNTSVNVRAEGLSHIYNEVEIKLSKSQIERACKSLCGIKDCTCGDDCGMRGPQLTNDGKRIIIDMSAIYA